MDTNLFSPKAAFVFFLSLLSSFSAKSEEPSTLNIYSIAARSYSVSWTTPVNYNYPDVWQLQEKFEDGSWKNIRGVSDIPGNETFIHKLESGTYYYRLQHCPTTGTPACQTQQTKSITIAAPSSTSTALSTINITTPSSGAYMVSWPSPAYVYTGKWFLQEKVDDGPWETIQDATTSTSKIFVKTIENTYHYRLKRCWDIYNTNDCQTELSKSVAVLIQPELEFPTIPGTGIPYTSIYSEPDYYGQIEGIHTVAQDGSFNYSIPIEVSPGINGMQPKLGINYNSNRMNGLVGWGWSLSGISSITRCKADLARDGYSSSINPGDNYKFCLDGQRLIEINPGEYRTEIESFSRIKRVGGTAAVPGYWTVETKDGSTLTFGNGNNSELLDIDGNAMTWYVNKQEDIAGNYMTYHYEITSTTMHRISHIEYSKHNSAQGTDKRVEFEYQSRQDHISGYVGGVRQVTDERLKAIIVKSEGDLVRKYGMAYSGIASASPYSKISNISLCFDVESTKCADSLSVGWYGGTFNYFTESTYFSNAESYIEPSDDIWSAINGDFDGNGIDDIAWMSGPSGNLKVALNGEEILENNPIWYTGQFYGFSYVADLNSDGFDDIVYNINDGKEWFWVLYSDGSSFSYDDFRNTPSETGLVGNNMDHVSDYNLDSIPDILEYDTNLKKYHLRPGPLFDSKELWADVSGFDINVIDVPINYDGSTLTYTGGPVYSTPLSGDVNGDGTRDLIACQQITSTSHECEPVVLLNSGNGFTDPVVWLDNSVFTVWPSLLESSQMADMNGDGLADIVFANYQGIRVFLSDGQQFIDDGLWAIDNLGSTSNWSWLILENGSSDYAVPASDIRFADLNNDSCSDIVLTPTETITANVNGAAVSTISSVYVSWSSCGTELGNGNKSYDFVELVNTGRQPATLQDVDGDGFLDIVSGVVTGSWGAGTGTLRYYKNRYINNFARSFISRGDLKSVMVSYKPLTDTSVYSVGGEGEYFAIDDRLSVSVTHPNTPSVVHVVDKVTRNRLSAPFNSTPSEEAPHEVVSEYFYHSFKTNYQGYGNLGFEKIEETVSYKNQSDLIKTVSEYHQDIDADDDHDYRLVGQLKTQLTCVVDSPEAGCITSGGGFNLISDLRNKWRIRIYDDDQDAGLDSPHFFPFIYQSSSTQWDLDGTKISDSRTQMNNASSYSCSAVSTSVLTTTSTSASYSLYGVPKYMRTVICDQSGTSQDVTARVIRNEDITDLTGSDWVVGLVGKVRSYAYASDSLASLDASKEIRRVDYDYFQGDSGNNRAGMLEKEIIEPENTNGLRKYTTSYSYNSYGSVSNILETWLGNSRTTAISETFNTNSERTVVTTNPLNQIETTVFNAKYGLPREAVDINGLTTSMTYDLAGRIDQITYPDGDRILNTYKLCLDCSSIVTGESWVHHIWSYSQPETMTYYDFYDRQIGTQNRIYPYNFAYTNTAYNAQGFVDHAIDPHFSGTASNDLVQTDYSYDLLGRNTRIDYPDGSFSTVAFNGATQTYTNQLGQTQTHLINAAGWVMQSIDNIGTPVDFTYTPWGDLETTRVNNNSDTDITIVYDKLGRKTSLDDPNTGLITYQYDAAGRLDYEINARNQKIDYDYDDLDRQIERIDDATGVEHSPQIHHWAYDNAPGKGKGKLESLTGVNTDGTAFLEAYSYDNLGRLTDVSTNIDGSDYTFTNVYDNYSRQVGTIYPTGYGIRAIYNDYGFVEKVENAEVNNHINLWILNEVDARGNVTDEWQIGSVTTESEYDPYFGRLTRRIATTATYALINQTYNYDSLGNLLSRLDGSGVSVWNASTVFVTESFCYDDLNRLEASAFGSSCGTVDTSYDALGNTISKEGISGIFSYGTGNAGPNAVTNASGVSYNYDASGNLISDTDGTSVSYTAYNKPTTISKEGNSSTVVYGPHKSRVKRIDGNGRITVYAGLGLYEETTMGGVTDKVHYLGDFGTYIVEEGTSVDSYYLSNVRDHLGSIVLKKDGISLSAEGEWLAYDPWGERLHNPVLGEIARWDSSPAGQNYITLGTTRGFTDHEHLDGVGLIHMNGRVYDPTLGRFMSPDPFVQAPYNTQSYNRYTYVFNNPLSLVDPSGYISGGACDDAYAGRNHAGRGSCYINPSVIENYNRAQNPWTTTSNLDYSGGPGTDAGMSMQGDFVALNSIFTLEEVKVEGKLIPISYGYGNNFGWLDSYWNFMLGGNRLFNQRAASALGNRSNAPIASPYIAPNYSSSATSGIWSSGSNNLNYNPPLNTAEAREYIALRQQAMDARQAMVVKGVSTFFGFGAARLYFAGKTAAANNWANISLFTGLAADLSTDNPNLGGKLLIEGTARAASNFGPVGPIGRQVHKGIQQLNSTFSGLAL